MLRKAGPLAAAAAMVIASMASAQIRDDAEALKKLKIPEGFEVRVFAGADICHNPTAIDVDIYGRVWVCEGVNYRATLTRGPSEPADPDADRIKVFEDTDGDGKADKVTVFADRIPVVPMSVCVVGDKVYTGVSPELWVFDGAANRDKPVGKNKAVLLKGFAKGGTNKAGYADHDHTLHGLMLSPDGRMHFTVGDVGMNVTDPSGKKHAPNGAAMVRMNLDGTGMRVLADNFRNPYELWVDAFGRVFCSDNDDDGNAQVRICFVLDGGDYGYRHNPKLPQSPTRHHWREDVPGVTPKILRTFAGSPCGIINYEGSLLPERFHGSLIHCDSGAPQAVRAYHMKPSGAGFVCETENLITSDDKWFRPVDVACAPDGSLYVADWYDSGVGGHSFRERSLGRIYHLTVKGAPPVAKTAAPELSTIPGLISALMSPMASVRHLAIKGLRERAAESTPVLVKLAKEGKHPQERARALAVLHGLGEPGRASLVDALNESDPRVRASAVRMLREDMETNRVQVINRLAQYAHETDPSVITELAIAIRDLPTDKAEHGLYGLVRILERMKPDPWLMPTVAAALRNREPEWFEKRTVFKHLSTNPEMLVAMAFQLRRVEAVPFLRALIDDPKQAAHVDGALTALGWIDDLPAAETAVALLKSADARVRVGAAAVLQSRLAGPWKAVAQTPAFADWLKAEIADPAKSAQAVNLAAAAGAKGLLPQIIAIAANDKADRVSRRAAVEALGKFGGKESIDALVGVVKTVAGGDEVGLVALAALASLKQDAAVEALALDAGRPLGLRREAVRALSSSTGGCKRLLDLAEKGTLPGDVKDEAARAVALNKDNSVIARAAKALPLPVTKLRPLPPAEKLLAKAGDPAAGRKVFFKKEAQCAKCHRVDGVGAWVGPDLSQIGGKYGRDGLLHNIVYPSDGIGHEYVQFAIRTETEQTFAGLIVEETADRVVLKDVEGRRIIVPAKEIAERKKLTLSIMPEGLASAISDTEITDLLAFLSTLKSPSISPTSWQAEVVGKAGSARKVSADREGRLDLEGALQTRTGPIALSTTVVSKADQPGKLVVLLPAGSTVTGTGLNFTAGSATEAGGLTPFTAELKLKAGDNTIALVIKGGDATALAAVATVVAAAGIEPGK